MDGLNSFIILYFFFLLFVDADWARCVAFWQQLKVLTHKQPKKLFSAEHTLYNLNPSNNQVINFYQLFINFLSTFFFFTLLTLTYTQEIWTYIWWNSGFLKEREIWKSHAFLTLFWICASWCGKPCNDLKLRVVV